MLTAYPQLLLRIVITGNDGKVHTNNTYNLGSTQWKLNIDRLAKIIPAMTNEVKIKLKKDGIVAIETDDGIVELIVQEQIPSGHQSSPSSEVEIVRT